MPLLIIRDESWFASHRAATRQPLFTRVERINGTGANKRVTGINQRHLLMLLCQTHHLVWCWRVYHGGANLQCTCNHILQLKLPSGLISLKTLSSHSGLISIPPPLHIPRPVTANHVRSSHDRNADIWSSDVAWRWLMSLNKGHAITSSSTDWEEGDKNTSVCHKVIEGLWDSKEL